MTPKKAPRKRKESVDITKDFEKAYKQNFDCSNITLKKMFPITDNQTAFYYLSQNEKTNMIFLNGPAGSAKAQPISEPIPTPNGWVTMSDLEVGDDIFSVSGNLTKVVGVFPQGIKKIYKVEFSDGTYTRCCGDHLWDTSDYNQRNKWTSKRIDGKKKKIDKLPPEYSTKTTLDIMDSLYKGERLNHMIPIITAPVKFKNVELPIDPYIFGQLLGDGSFRSKPIRITTSDKETVDYFQKSFADHFKHLKDYSYRISGLNQIITDLGLMNTYSHEKFIPDIYKMSSVEDRISLIQGLMDSDGTVKRGQGGAIIVSTSEKMMDDLTEVINSLGGITYKTSRIGRLYGVNHKMTYTLHINLPDNITPFRLSRKIEIYKPNNKYSPKRYIHKITECGEEECKCIKIDDGSMLYLTNNYIVTHNTYLSMYTGMELLKDRKIDKIIYIRSVVESSSRSIGSLPGELDDKFMPYAAVCLEKASEIVDKSTLNALIEQEYIKTIPVNFVRGLTFNNALVIVDEAQNLNKSELITILTRFGRHSKYIISGDLNQSDIKDSGFKEMFTKFDTEFSRKNNIHCVNFDTSDIVRSQILKHICQVLSV